MTVTQVHVHVLVKAYAFGFNLSRSFDGEAEGFTAPAGSIVNYSCTYQYTANVA